MKANRKLVWTLLMLVVVTFALSPVVSAKDGVKMKRDSKDLKGAVASTSFGDVPSTTDESCSGSCSCSTCTCSGSFSCCSAGCDACWDYRDSQGLCDAS